MRSPLAAAVAAHKDDMEAAFEEYERTARPPVTRVQDAARPSLSWWERFGVYHDAFEPWQFAYHFLTRSISDGRLARRDADFIASSHRAWQDRFGAAPLDTPVSHGGWSASGRVVTVTEEAGVPTSVLGDGPPLPLGTGDAGSGPWGALVHAPDDEAAMAAAKEHLAALVEQQPSCVAVHGGTDLTRVLLSEEARLQHGVPSLLIDHDADQDRALTAVLSGRTDLVGISPETAAGWAAAT